MCVGGLHVILRASRRAGVHTQNRGRSLDSYCRRQSRPGSRIEPPVLDLEIKEPHRIRQPPKPRLTLLGTELDPRRKKTCSAPLSTAQRLTSPLVDSISWPRQSGPSPPCLAIERMPRPIIESLVSIARARSST